MEGLIAFGMNPVANGPNTPKMLAALSKLKWLIVADCFETETASFWKAKDLAEKYYATAPDAAAIDTEVFLLPAACFAEKDGAFVNSSRWAQWKNVALDPPGEALARSGNHRAPLPEDSRALRRRKAARRRSLC